MCQPYIESAAALSDDIQYIVRENAWHTLEGATYCIGVAECSGGNDLPRSQTPYLNVVFG